MMKDTYMRKLIESGNRLDGRAFDQYRPVKIDTGIVTSAEGSARVKLGKSLVVAGVKLDVKEPYPDTPNQGNLMIDGEFIPFASPEFEPGPPSEEAVELARVVDRAVRESHCIDLEKLCITPSELVWAVNIDIHVLDHDGNLIDAACLAAVAALLTSHFPKFDKEKKAVVRDQKPASGDRLPMADRPVEVTVWKLAGKLLIDPEMEEQEAAEARVTMATKEDGRLCAMQKGGKGFFTSNELLQAADLAVEKGNELRSMLPPL